MNESFISKNLDASLSSISQIQKSIEAMEAHLQGLPNHKPAGRKNNPHTKSLKLISQVKQGLVSTQQKMNQIQKYLANPSPNSIISPQSDNKALIAKEPRHEAREFSHESSEESPVEKIRKKRRSNANVEIFEDNKQRGDYVTVTAEVRSQLFKILHEQAQIWYDIFHNQYLDRTNKSKRWDLLISSEKLSNNHIPTEPLLHQDFETEDLDYLDLHDSAEKYNIRQQQSLPTSYNHHHPMSLDLDPRIFFDTSEADFGVQSNFGEPLQIKQEENLLSFAADESLFHGKTSTVSKEDLSESKADITSKGKNRVTEISVAPLDGNISLTIPEKDIIKYLKENEDYVSEENKKSDSNHQQKSILKALSQLTGVHEKTLKRFAESGPIRKAGGGRKRMDSIMEDRLTYYVVELNKRGRPVTRGEVKALATILSTIPGFAASKGWLDKYFYRINAEISKGNTELKNYWKIISFTDLKKVEAEKKILDCLVDMNADEAIIQRFRTIKNRKEELSKFEDSSEENDDDSLRNEENCEIYIADDINPDSREY